jgi:hypothetical protein
MTPYTTTARVGSAGRRENDVDTESVAHQTLTATEAGLIMEARELAADMQAYRELMQVSIGEVARLTRLVQSQSGTIRSLHDELRRYTEAQIERAA